MLAEIFGVDGVIVLIVVVVLLFGGAAIPKLARNLGSAKNEFEKGLEDGKKASSSSSLAGSNGTAAAAADTGSGSGTLLALPGGRRPHDEELTAPDPRSGLRNLRQPGGPDVRLMC